MDMIGHTACAVTFTSGVSGNSREVGVERRTDRRAQPRNAVLGTEDDVEDHFGEGLRHGGKYGLEKRETL